MSEILVTEFFFFALATLILIIVLICVQLYEIFEEPNIQKRMRQLRKSAQPWVTVLLYVRDNETKIEVSLRALLKSNYYKFDVVVVNDCSTDGSLQRVREFMASHPNSPIRVLNRRVKRLETEALQAGYRKSQGGEVVISMRAGVIVPPSFLKRAVATKNQQNSVTLRMSEIILVGSLNEIIQSLNAILWRKAYKARVSNARDSTLAKESIRLDSIGVLLFTGLIITSLFINEAIIFWYAWLLVTGYIYAVIWLNEEKIRTKLKLSFSALSAFFLLPVASCIVGLSQFHSRN